MRRGELDAIVDFSQWYLDPEHRQPERAIQSGSKVQFPLPGFSSPDHFDPRAVLFEQDMRLQRRQQEVMIAGSSLFITGSAEIRLGGSSAEFGGVGLYYSNDGLITGGGRIIAVLDNRVDGEVRVGAGQSLILANPNGTAANNGKLVIGSGGTLESARGLDNNGSISGEGTIHVGQGTYDCSPATA
jgi:hypothetical protein